MYILLNREDVVVDVVETLRFTKLQSQSNIVIGCEKDEATGVISSDGVQHIFIESDMTHNPNAVKIIELDKIPSNVTPGKYKYDSESNSLVYRYTLDETKSLKQEENKILFAQYLVSHPLTWVDGKEYGVTEQDQSEISLNLNQYAIAVQAGVDAPTLEWHARHEECKPWTLEDLTALSLAISAAVYPMYHIMQQYKTEIYACNSIEEVDAVVLKYGEDNII